MSIALTGIKLENASIQYTYPEMNIKNITKESGNVVKFYFQSSIAASTFTFIDSSSNSYISGIPAQGTISKCIHEGNDYELTIKHISPTVDKIFYVVFPLKNGGESSIIDKIIENTTGYIDIYTDETVGIKGLNDIIKASYKDSIPSNKIYKYTGAATPNTDVFVFEKPLLVNISNKITEPHKLWTRAGDIKFIDTESNTQVLEEIECDYSGDTIKEPEINNKNLSKTFSRVGSITIFFAVFALYTAFFYKYLAEIYSYYSNNSFTAYVIIFLYVIVFVGVAVAFALPNSYKNINFLNIDVFKPASFYALLFIPLWDFAYRLMMLLVYSSIYELQSSVYEFIFSYFKSDAAESDAAENYLKKYNMFLLGLLLIIWVLFVCVLLVK